MRQPTRQPRASTAKLAVIGGSLGLSAYLMALALQLPEGRWVGWCALLPLLLAVRVLSPWRALAAGSFWGLCFFFASLIGGHAPFIPDATSLALLTVVPGLYACAGSVVTRRAGFSPLLLGLGWVFVELALIPVGMRHGLLAGTQGDGVVVTVLGNLVGYAMVAFLVAYVNAALLSVLSSACVSGSSKLLVRASGSSPARFIPTELPVDILHILRLWQPRGPPA